MNKDFHKTLSLSLSLSPSVTLCGVVVCREQLACATHAGGVDVMINVKNDQLIIEKPGSTDSTPAHLYHVVFNCPSINHHVIIIISAPTSPAAAAARRCQAEFALRTANVILTALKLLVWTVS